MSELEPTRTYSNPTATEVLRRLLDERGVEYEGGERSVRWRDHNGVMMQAFPLANGELGMDVWSCTPEQAITATLGATDAKPTQVESSGTCEADETDLIPFVRADSADFEVDYIHVMECTECGHVYEHVNGDYEYCPRCGRKRKDVDA